MNSRPCLGNVFRLMGSMIVYCCIVSMVMAQTPVPECTSHTGDLNLDGYVSSGDAQQAFLVALGSIVPTPDEWCAADCNGDGVVSSGDAQAIFFKALGMGECAEVPTATPTDTPTAPPIESPTPTMPPTATPTIPSGGNLISVDPIVGNMRYVPAGTFTQGSPSGEACRNASETQFAHHLTRNLAVMETEVTRQMWASLRAVQVTLPVDPSNATYSPSMNHPVQEVSWFKSVLFCNLLSLQNGYTRCYYTDAGFTNPITSSNYTAGPFYCNFEANGYRLPSEGEWEYFARAGTTTTFSCNETNYTSGNCTSCTAGTHPTLAQYCLYCANDPGGTAAVGSKVANPWNLRDVHGNVWEWCWDRYSATYPSPSATDYTGPESGSSRVRRGGGFFNGADDCRSANRISNAPSYSHYNIGFRLLREAP